MESKPNKTKHITDKDEQYKWLVQVFKDAGEAAKLADPGEGNDGGTCNFDSPAFRVKGWGEKMIAKLAEEAGLSVCRFSWFGSHNWYWLNVPLHGQANRRSTMSTAASKVFQKAMDSENLKGFSSCQYCQMD